MKFEGKLPGGCSLYNELSAYLVVVDVAAAAGVLLIVFVDSMRRMCICEMKNEQQQQ